MIEFQFHHFADEAIFPIHLQYGFHNENLYMHSHKDFSELVIVLDGSAEHMVNDECSHITKGDVFVINQCTSHCYVNVSDLKICNIMFQPELVFSNVLDMKRLPGFQALFILEPHYARNHRFCSQLSLGVRDYAEAEHFIRHMIAVYTAKETGWRDEVHAQFLLFCLMLSRCYGKHTVHSDYDFVKLAKAAAYLEDHYCEPLTTAVLSGIAGYSERQFLRLFKSVFLTTPNLYQTRLRMNKARNLLDNEKLSIGEVAWRCGYDDHNYFSRVFKKYFGMTPKQYQLRQQP